MSFEDEVTKTGKEMGGGSDFYKFKDGDNKVHILTEPKIQVSRYGYGICYEGAPYCQEATLQKEYEEALVKAREEEKDLKKVQKANLTKKWMCWAIDRKTGSLFILTLPYTVSKAITALKTNEETKWDGWPMPFGINIIAENAGDIKVKYQVVASRKDTAITEEELAQLAKKRSVEDILARMKEKQIAKMSGTTSAETTQVAEGSIEYPEEDINPDDIPF